MSFRPEKQLLARIFELLSGLYGNQNWWPGDTPFEVMIGAILTQNTAWPNVEMAISNLKQADSLSPDAILKVEKGKLAELIRPSGYFNLKSDRLKNLCGFLQQEGGETALGKLPTEGLRKAFLSVNGIGPETADDILLYAFERPVFVIDAYTRRIFSRIGICNGDEQYEELRAGFENALGPDVELYNEYHALIVRHAKETCTTKLHCEQCSLVELCFTGADRQGLPRRSD